MELPEDRVFFPRGAVQQSGLSYRLALIMTSIYDIKRRLHEVKLGFSNSILPMKLLVERRTDEGVSGLPEDQPCKVLKTGKLSSS